MNESDWTIVARTLLFVHYARSVRLAQREKTKLNWKVHFPETSIQQHAAKL